MRSNGKDYVVRRIAGAIIAMVLLCGWVLCASGQPGKEGDLVVNTKSGQLRGVARAGGGAEFLGIPYAEPPVGELRWRATVAVHPWKEVRDASTFGAPCAQPILGDWNRRAAEYAKEDCLFLNVISAQWPVKTKLPVMFWIHGGANEGGTASSPLYKDGTLVQHGILLVTANYRLGVFGFFAHPELTRESPNKASGNYGLMDLIEALRWVHENIAEFGGDPENVTVFGQSAGAQDASFLMTSPLAKGLFQKVIAESGAALNPNMRSLAASEQAGEKLAEAWKAPANGGAVKFLRQLSAGELLQGMPKQSPEEDRLAEPNVDGWVLPRLPAADFAAGEQTAVPMIIGSTTREFGWDASTDELRKTIERIAGSQAPKALSLYGLADGGQGTNDPLYGPAGNQWIADLVFRCPAVTQAKWNSATKQPTYEYQFEHAIPGQEAEGAVHSSDLPYVFGYYPKSGNIAGKFSDVDFKLAELIETYWTNFAKRGNPNGEGLPNWPEYDGSQAFIEFTQDGKALAQTSGLRKPQCDLQRELLMRRISGNEKH